MEILYYIINFAILAAGLFIVGRKTVVSIFKTRREKIDFLLNEAKREVTVNDDEPVKISAVTDESDDPAIGEEKKIQERKVDRVNTYAEHECREISFEKLKNEISAVMAMLTESVAKKYRADDDLSREHEVQERIIDDILSKMVLTPGDMSYLKHHDVLYVTLTSAVPVSEELVRKVDDATKALLDTVNGKTSLWVKTDETLIGGLRLRIGDTVYDGTVSEHLYRLSNAVEKVQFSENDTIKKIMSAFEEKANDTKNELYIYQLGRVISVSDGICWMDGLADIMYGEVVEFECGERGMVLDIQKDRIGCVIFGRYEHIESYSKVRRVGRIASVPVGSGLLGRVVDAIGNPIDGNGIIRHDEKRPIEAAAPGILDRRSVFRPMHTGLKAIDALVPIGKGQRELLVGDRQTGKTAIVIDAILNQKGKDVICIYVGIGQKESTVSDLREKLDVMGALPYTIIVSASASDSAAMQYIAPFAGTAMGEYFMYSGKDVLIIYDDLSKHAVAYRELSLLLQRPSGREAYPGDIFYLHSRLLERSAQLSDELGGGSMTAMPIIETQAGDISSYIPTNVISITDGQIFLESELFHEGQRPAVNVGLSVSRVGGAAQTKLMKQVSSSLRTKLAQYRELAEFTQFGADIDEETKRTLNSGEHLTAALRQNCHEPIEDWKQAVLLFAVIEGLTDGIPVSDMQKVEKTLFEGLENGYPDIVKVLGSGAKMSPEFSASLKNAIAEILKEY